MSSNNNISSPIPPSASAFASPAPADPGAVMPQSPPPSPLRPNTARTLSFNDEQMGGSKKSRKSKKSKKSRKSKKSKKSRKSKKSKKSRKSKTSKKSKKSKKSN